MFEQKITTSIWKFINSLNCIYIYAIYCDFNAYFSAIYYLPSFFYIVFFSYKKKSIFTLWDQFNI